MPFAESTSVPIERSQAQIKALAVKAGCEQYATFDDIGRASIIFTHKGRMVRFDLNMPNKDDPRFGRTPTRHQARGPAARQQAWEQECRRVWRALWLVIKAKLEAVETGITTFEDEFLSHFVTANGETLGQRIVPQLEHITQAGGSLVKLLGGPEI